MTDTLTNLRAANIARQIEWCAGAVLSLSYKSNELAGETGEVCNKIKKVERERLGMVGSRATIGEVAEEIADVIICCDLLAIDLDIDLGAAVAAKFNATSRKNGLATLMPEGTLTPKSQSYFDELRFVPVGGWPDFTAMTDGDLLSSVGMEAPRWAEAFRQYHADKPVANDVDLMLGWFANAIMAGYDRGCTAGFERGYVEAQEDFTGGVK